MDPAGGGSRLLQKVVLTNQLGGIFQKIWTVYDICLWGTFIAVDFLKVMFL
jgi:hypothetical protein